MWKTILRRVLLMIPQVIILSVLIFLLAQAMPGDPFTGLINPNQDPAVIEQMRQAAGLNDPSVGSEMLCKAILVKVSYTNALLLT